jgi:hypothetical protein
VTAYSAGDATSAKPPVKRAFKEVIHLPQRCCRPLAFLTLRLFAQRFLDDHNSAGNKLKAVVSGQPSEWPAQLADKDRKTAEELAQKQGAESIVTG